MQFPEQNEEMEFNALMGKGNIHPKNVSMLYEYYISGAITGPENYINIFDQIRHARAEDEVRIYLNSYGGDLYTAVQFMRVLRETQAFVTCSVEGACISAATLIFLSADNFEVTPHSSFMIHNYSGGTVGKGKEMYDQLAHERKWSETLFKEVYEDFLTEAEITAVLEGRDLWMDVSEVADRMNARIQVRKELEELEKATRPD